MDGHAESVLSFAPARLRLRVLLHDDDDAAYSSLRISIIAIFLGTISVVSFISVRLLPSLLARRRAHHHDHSTLFRVVQSANDSLLHHRLGKPPTNRVLRAALGWLLALTLGELLVLTGYGLLLGIWIYFAYDHLRDDGESVPSAYGLALGHAMQLQFAFMLLPVSRRSLWLAVFGIPYERAAKFHRMLARTLVVTASVHAGLEIAKEVGRNEVGDIFSWAKRHGHGPRLFPGLLSWISMLLIAIFSIGIVRRRAFELFRVVHVLALAVFGFAIAHAAETAVYVLPGAVLYGIDLLDRIRSGMCAPLLWRRRPQVVALKVFSDVTRIKIRAPAFKYAAGQWIYLHIPAVSPFQTHPFSISSAPTKDDDTLTVHVKDMGPGTFTHNLAAIAQHLHLNPAHVLASEFKVSIQGPYGRLPIDPAHYPALVLVGGGIGVTPLASILADVAARKSAGGLPVLHHVFFVWVVRDATSLTWFLDALESATERSKDHITVLLYVTGHKSHSAGHTPFPLHSGRPDLHAILSAVKHGEELEKALGVAVKVPSSTMCTHRTTSHAAIAPAINGKRSPSMQDDDSSDSDAGGGDDLGAVHMGALTSCDCSREQHSLVPHVIPSRIGVMACGPEALMDATERVCAHLSDSRSAIHFHRETFNL